MPDHFSCPCCNPLIGDAYRLHHTEPALAPALALALVSQRDRMGIRALSGALLASGTAFSGASHTSSPVHTNDTMTRVFVGATVLSVDENFSVAEALAIRGERIVACGTRADVMAEAGPDAIVIDAKGKTILPGFIEPHMHFLPIATLGQWEDVGASRFADIPAALSNLRKHTQAKKAGEWILARQIDPSLQAGVDGLNADALDGVSADNPVLVLNASLHFGYCNTKALELAGINRDTADPAGAVFVRRADGTPNGVLKGGAALMAVFKVVDAMADLNLVEAALGVCAKANAVGVTTFCDQGTGAFGGRGDLAVYKQVAASGRMTARLRYSLFDTSADAWDEMGIAFGQGDALIRATGWKIVSDGSNQGLTGYQREPYLNSDETGLPYVEADALKEKIEKRLRAGWQVVIHGNGDRAIDIILDAFEQAKARGASLEKRPRIEHCSILHDDQIARIKALGISPSFLIGHVYYWGKAFRDEIFGAEKAALLDRTASCEKAGIVWTLHSDDSVTEMGPLRCIHNAVTRQMWREPESTLAPEECVSVEAAIRAMTRDAAWQCHSEHEVGSLEPGKFADFVILPVDPRKVDPLTLKDIAVEETWMNGAKVYARGA